MQKRSQAFFNLCMISCIDSHPTYQHCIEVKEHHLNMKLERQIKQTLTSGPTKCVPHKHVERIPYKRNLMSGHEFPDIEAHSCAPPTI